MTFKVLACGGRDFKGRQRVYDVLNAWHKERAITHLIHGGALGADTLAGQWAQTRGVQEVKCAANWTKHGKGAGPIRNRRMLELKPDIVIAFPGGRGTADMVKVAKEASIMVVEVKGTP